MAWMRERIEIPKNLNKTQRKALAAEIIDFIVERSKKGKDKNNRPLPGYTKEYKALKRSLKGSSEVDLTLSGDMLDSISLLSDNPGSILIGFENGSEENAKAEGNIKGTYGQRSPIPGKKRDFLGITKKDLKELTNRVKGFDADRLNRLATLASTLGGDE